MQTAKKNWRNILYILILLVAICILFRWYSTANSYRIENQCLNFAMDSARQSSKRIDSEFNNAVLRLRNYAYLLSSGENPLEITTQLLKGMEENASFDEINFADVDGVNLTSSGIIYNCSDRDYFIKGMRGESGLQVVERSRLTDEKMMVFYAPVEHNGEIVGVLLGLYLAEDYLQEMLSISYFNESAGAYLCTREGQVIASSDCIDTSDYSGLLTDLLVSTNVIDSNTASGIREVFQGEKDEIGFICDSGCLTDNLCVIHVPNNEYLLVQTFPKNVTQKMVKDANRTGMMLQIILIALFLAYIFILVIQEQRRRHQLEYDSQEHITGLKKKEQQARVEISRANRKERQYRIAITSAAFCTFEFNLTKDLLEQDIVCTVDKHQISLLENIGLIVPCQASVCFERWKKFILKESLEEYSASVNTEYLKKCFEEGEAEVVVDFWCMASASKRTQMCVRQSFIMTRDERTGDIMVMVVSKDITSQVQKQREQTQILQEALMQAQHANSAKTTFLSNMSHDIRTPMNAIIGFTSIAMSHIDNEEQVRGCLQKVLSSSNHLLSLINDILDMSRIESGKIHIKEQECNISVLTHNLVSIIQPQVKAKQLDLFVNTFDVTNEDVIADSLKLSQIFVNILSNAVKYTPAGGTVSFSIRQLTSSHQGYSKYLFVVKDTGIGMSPDFVKHIFEPFEREASTTKTGIQGTGLGMAITKNIVDMMGGTITVSSEKDKGSEFSVELNLKLQDHKIDDDLIDELKSLRVMVVDDDRHCCESITHMLNQIGIRAEWTTSGKEAVCLAESALHEGDSYDTYIIDWQMLEMSGIETCCRIRDVVGDSATIIILTAYDWTDIEEEAQEAGVTTFCAKPLFMSDLKSTLLEVNNPRKDEQSHTEVREDFSGKCILLVEDNELNREIAQEILEEAGFLVETAPDGTDALEMVKASEEYHYDAILMDVQMPSMNGYESTQAIRVLPRKDVNDLPIIAMTANAMEEDKEVALKHGMTDHIAKPLDITLFLSILSKFLINSPTCNQDLNKQ